MELECESEDPQEEDADVRVFIKEEPIQVGYSEGNVIIKTESRNFDPSDVVIVNSDTETDEPEIVSSLGHAYSNQLSINNFYNLGSNHLDTFVVTNVSRLAEFEAPRVSFEGQDHRKLSTGRSPSSAKNQPLDNNAVDLSHNLTPSNYIAFAENNSLVGGLGRSENIQADQNGFNLPPQITVNMDSSSYIITSNQTPNNLAFAENDSQAVQTVQNGFKLPQQLTANMDSSSYTKTNHQDPTSSNSTTDYENDDVIIVQASQKVSLSAKDLNRRILETQPFSSAARPSTFLSQLKFFAGRTWARDRTKPKTGRQAKQDKKIDIPVDLVEENAKNDSLVAGGAEVYYEREENTRNKDKGIKGCEVNNHEGVSGGDIVPDKRESHLTQIIAPADSTCSSIAEDEHFDFDPGGEEKAVKRPKRKRATHKRNDKESSSLETFSNSIPVSQPTKESDMIGKLSLEPAPSSEFSPTSSLDKVPTSYVRKTQRQPIADAPTTRTVAHRKSSLSSESNVSHFEHKRASRYETRSRVAPHKENGALDEPPEEKGDLDDDNFSRGAPSPASSCVSTDGSMTSSKTPSSSSNLITRSKCGPPSKRRRIVSCRSESEASCTSNQGENRFETEKRENADFTRGLSVDLDSIRNISTQDVSRYESLCDKENVFDTSFSGKSISRTRTKQEIEEVSPVLNALGGKSQPSAFELDRGVKKWTRQTVSISPVPSDHIKDDSTAIASLSPSSAPMRRKPRQFPCGNCHRQCVTSCIFCEVCNSWYHARCEDLSHKELKSWGRSEVKYKCLRCSSKLLSSGKEARKNEPNEESKKATTEEESNVTKSMAGVMSYLFGENMDIACPSGFTINVRLELQKKEDSLTQAENGNGAGSSKPSTLRSCCQAKKDAGLYNPFDCPCFKDISLSELANLVKHRIEKRRDISFSIRGKLLAFILEMSQELESLETSGSY